MAQVEMTPQEARTIDKAIQLLRDRHYQYYHNSANPDGDVAQGHRQKAQWLDELRFRITKEVL
jgi:hypothetical protein